MADFFTTDLWWLKTAKFNLLFHHCMLWEGRHGIYPWAMQKYLNIFQWIFLAFSLFGIILFNYTWLKFWGNYANVACECVSRVIEFVLKRSSHLLHKGIVLPFTTRETPHNYFTKSYVFLVCYMKSRHTHPLRKEVLLRRIGSVKVMFCFDEFHVIKC